MPAAPDTTVQVDAYFDLICPWCWIGKAHWTTARRLLAERQPGVQVQMRWHSVQLIPQVPPQGWPYQAFYEHRLGGPQAVRTRRAQVQAAAARAGLTIEHERIAVFPNTWRDHQVLASLAQAHGVDSDLAEAFDTPPVWTLPEGASGVPLFVFNQHHTLSGAQPPEILLAALSAAGQSAS